tara:strand:+ start:3574 stop:4071 length:498 start_codon:yes stop_codon:yes gene_type:complete
MKTVIFTIGLSALFASCKQNTEKAYLAANTQETADLKTQPDEAYTLMKNNCYVCHNPQAASHDDIIAPPFKVVKMRYTNVYDNKTDFINAMVHWVQNPEEEKALMRGAVNRFKVMPKLDFPTEDLEKIAVYIYDNDLEEPTWMEEHMQKQHGNGKGMGKGKMNKN